MATRTAASATDLTEQTWSSGVALEGANHTYSPPADETVTHWVTAVASLNGGATADPFGALDDLSFSDLGNVFDNLDYRQGIASQRDVFGPSPAANQKLSHFIVGSAGGAKAKHSHTLSLELRDISTLDQEAVSLGTSTTTSSTFQVKATRTFTPATEGDYLVIGEALLKHGSTSSEVECHLNFDSGTFFNVMRHQPKSTSEWVPWSCVVGFIAGETAGFDGSTGLTAAAHTMAIEFRSRGGSATASIKRARLTILRLDTFKNFYYEENASRARQTTSSASYSTKLTNAPDILNAGNHLIFADAHVDGTGGSGRFTGGQITAGGTTVLESLYFPRRSLGQDDAALRMFRLEDLDAGESAANTWTIDIQKGGSGVGAVGCEHATICVIELEEAQATKEVFLGRLAGMPQVVLAHTSQ
jgi:hypothetical protein